MSNAAMPNAAMRTKDAGAALPLPALLPIIILSWDKPELRSKNRSHVVAQAGRLPHYGPANPS